MPWIEGGGAGAASMGRAARGRFALGAEALDSALGGGLARGRLHEIYAQADDDGASAAGFALLLAWRARAPGHPRAARILPKSRDFH